MSVLADHDRRQVELATSYQLKREAIARQVSLTDVAMGGVAYLAQRQGLYESLAPHAAGILNAMVIGGAINISRLQVLDGDW